MNFNTKTVGKVTGLTARRLDYWDKSNFIKPSVQEASGQGSVRLYSFTDLIQMRVAKMLLDKGVSLQKLRKAITYLKKHMKEIERPLAQLRFLTDGETIFVLAEDNQQIIDTLRGGQLVFSIALGEIVQDLKSSVVAMQEKKRYSVSIGNKKYQVTLHQDSEDRLYRVACPEFIGCASHGDTVEEALEMIKDAIRESIEVADEQKTFRNAS
jgi:predicted RNase H-like HicB family nuclease